jgi:hypothetical protein
MWPYDRGAIPLAEEMWDLGIAPPSRTDLERESRRFVRIGWELEERASDFIDLPLSDIATVLAATELIGMDEETGALHAAAAVRVLNNPRLVAEMTALEMAVAR